MQDRHSPQTRKSLLATHGRTIHWVNCALVHCSKRRAWVAHRSAASAGNRSCWPAEKRYLIAVLRREWPHRRAAEQWDGPCPSQLIELHPAPPSKGRDGSSCPVLPPQIRRSQRAENDQHPKACECGRCTGPLWACFSRTPRRRSVNDDAVKIYVHVSIDYRLA